MDKEKYGPYNRALANGKVEKIIGVHSQGFRNAQGEGVSASDYYAEKARRSEIAYTRKIYR